MRALPVFAIPWETPLGLRFPGCGAQDDVFCLDKTLTETTKGNHNERAG